MKNQLLTVAQSQAVLTHNSKADERTRLQQFWQSIRVWLQLDQELKVWQERDRRGEILWCAYNPLTGQEVAFSTEEQMRQWIENPNPRGSRQLCQ